MAAVILHDASVAEDVARLRSRFTDLGYRFALDDAGPAIERLTGELTRTP
jgi:hypothetical protein